MTISNHELPLNLHFFIFNLLLDSCQVNNGGCDINARCSHDPDTNAVLCTCNTGFVDSGSNSESLHKCTGTIISKYDHLITRNPYFSFVRHVQRKQWRM